MTNELKAQPSGVVLSDEELWSIRNQVAINEVLRDDDSVKICVKHGRAIEQAVIARLNQPASAGDDRETIRAVFLRNGFTIKEGQADLKPYVYAAADELMSIARAALSPARDGATVKQSLTAGGVDERAAFEQALRTLPDSTGAIAVAIECFDPGLERYYKEEACSGLDLNSFFVVWKLARSAVSASHGEQVREWSLAADELPSCGKPVLAYYLNSHGMGRRIRAMHVKRFTVEAEEFADPDTQCCEYSEQDDCYYTTEGWYELIDNWPDYASCAVIEGVITHWTDMPEAPSPASHKEQGE